jgi:vacuolar-type H+-ATPase subunit H
VATRPKIILCELGAWCDEKNFCSLNSQANIGVEKLSNHEHNNPDPAGLVIESIALREQELQAMLNQARAEADLILSEARTQADQLLKTAGQELLRQAEQKKKEMSDKTAGMREQRISQAQQEVDNLKQKSQTRRQQAVEAVVQRVLPEEQ